MQLLLLFLAVIPVVVILSFIYIKDKNKEPGKLLILLFGLGIASCFMVLAVSDLIFMIFPFMQKGSDYMTFFELMAYAFIGVALIEEFCKFFMTYLCGYRSKAYDEVYDGIVYAVFVSLGFAFFENLLYVFKNQSISVGISRGLLAVPGHACDAVFMGYYLSVAKVYAHQNKKNLEKKNLAFSILVPTILHGIYDFCLFTGEALFIILFLVFVVFVYIAAFKKIKQLSSQSKQKKQVVKHKGFEPQAVDNSQYTKANTNSNNINNKVQNNNQNNNHHDERPTNGYFQAPDIVPPNNVGFVQSTSTGYIQNAPSIPGNINYVNGNTSANFQPNASGFCSQCGAPLAGSFCSRCGARQVK